MMELRVHQAAQEIAAQVELVGLVEIQELAEHLVRLAQVVLLEHQAQVEHLGSLALRVHQVQAGLQAHQVQAVIPEVQELLVQVVKAALLGHLEPQELPEQVELQGAQELMEHRDRQAHRELEKMVHQEVAEHLEKTVHLVHQVIVGVRVRQDLRGVPERQEVLDHLDHLEYQVHQGARALRELQGALDRVVALDHLVQVVHRELQVHLEVEQDIIT